MKAGGSGKASVSCKWRGMTWAEQHVSVRGGSSQAKPCCGAVAGICDAPHRPETGLWQCQTPPWRLSRLRLTQWRDFVVRRAPLSMAPRKLACAQIQQRHTSPRAEPLPVPRKLRIGAACYPILQLCVFPALLLCRLGAAIYLRSVAIAVSRAARSYIDLRHRGTAAAVALRSRTRLYVTRSRAHIGHLRFSSQEATLEWGGRGGGRC
jgi:hypothetical protein